MSQEQTATVGKLSVWPRLVGKKGHARKVRRDGLVPAVCYGPALPTLSIALRAEELRACLDPQRGTNTLIEMDIAGQNERLDVLLRATDHDPLTGRLLHADFMVVRPGEEVRVEVPVILLGKPEGVTQGGILHQLLRKLRVACRPDRIPVKLELDVTALKLGHALHVSDLALGEGVRPLVDLKEAVAVVVAPKEEKTSAEEAAAAATTAEAAAEPVAGAAPAPGAPAPTSGAPAPTPAQPDKKEKKK